MKIFRIIYYIFCALIVLLALLFILSSLPINGNYKVLTVLSGSMEPAIRTGSTVIVAPENDYKVGDVITFKNSMGREMPITHRIYDIRVENSQIVYITKGDANNTPDIESAYKKNIEGRVLFSIPCLGYVVNFAKKPLGFALIIIIPSLIIIGDEIRKIYGEVKNKKEEIE